MKRIIAVACGLALALGIATPAPASIGEVAALSGTVSFGAFPCAASAGCTTGSLELDVVPVQAGQISGTLQGTFYSDVGCGAGFASGEARIGSSEQAVFTWSREALAIEAVVGIVSSTSGRTADQYRMVLRLEAENPSQTQLLASDGPCTVGPPVVATFTAAGELVGHTT